MIDRMRARRVAGGMLAACAIAVIAVAQPRVTTPKEHFGFNMGDDYQLANYTQIEAYWKLLDQQSDRMILEDIGKTAEGRTQWMAVITSPENHKKLARYKEIARRLALAEGLTDEQARALAREGKAIVWFDGGLHATEVLNFTQLTETVYQLTSRSDEETMRFLRDCIILAVHANPDGNELVANWYMRQPDKLKRTTQGIPRLYQKYAGHDNNRDFYANNLAESTNMSRALFREWFPQIMYNHHQTGPTGTVLFAPPFRDPPNYNFHPLMVVGLDLVGAAMHNRFVAENKPGATMRRGANYSTWYNGGLRTATYFHNMIGLLTESIGNPTPMQIPFVPERNIMSGDLPFPITPQAWHFRQSVEYSLTANRAVFDVASRYRETFLYNIYQAGRDSIARGSTDTWTIWPARIAAVRSAVAKDRQGADGEFNPTAAMGGFSPTVDQRYFSLLRDPAQRDPRAYILPSNQRDFLTATTFMNMLIKSGIVVHRATADFTVGGKTYPRGSYVVKTAQAFRPHVMDMFEPQDHPNDIPAPGAPPTPPYDNAGYTMAYQMGVQFDRILEGVEGPFEAIADEITPAPATVPDATGVAGYVIDHGVNDAVVAINRLLKNGDEVYFVKGPLTVNGRSLGQGAIYVPARPQTRAVVEGVARDKGLGILTVTAKPAGDAYRVRPVRIGLWDRYGGSMPSGWIRWILEHYEFPYELVFPQALDAGNLHATFDVIVFPDGAIPENDRPGRRPGTVCRQRARGVPHVGRRHDRGEVGAVDQGLRRRRGHGARDWRFDIARASPGPPLDESRGRATGQRHRAARAAREVLRAGIGAARGRRCLAPAGLGHGDAGRRVLRQQPGLQARSVSRARGRDARGLVRLRGAVAQRVGMGPVVPRRWRRGGGREGGQGPGVPLRPRDHVPRAAARHVQVPVQRSVPGHGNAGSGCRTGGGDPLGRSARLDDRMRTSAAAPFTWRAMLACRAGPPMTRLAAPARACVVLLASFAYLNSVFQLSSDVFWTHGLGDWMDPYFINYLLEHWYRSVPAFRNPASPPMFFPVAATLGYSHGLVLFAPFYAAVRPFVHPFQAHGLALVLAIEVGIVGLYLVCRRLLRLSFVESCLLTAFFTAAPNVMSGPLGVWSQRASIFLVAPIVLMTWEAARMPAGTIRTIVAAVSGLVATLLFTQDFYTGQFALLILALALAPAAATAIPGAASRAGALWHAERPAARAALGLTTVAAAWTLAIAATGGFVFRLAGLRIASNDWRRPALVAAVGLAGFAWLRRRPLSFPRPTGRDAWLLPFAAGASTGGLVFLWCYLGAYQTLGAFSSQEVNAFIAARDVTLWTSPLEVVGDLATYDSMRSFYLVFTLGVLAWVPWFGVDRRTRLYGAWFLLISFAVLLVPIRVGDFSLWDVAVRPLPGFAVIRDPRRIIYHYELAAAVAIGLFMARLDRRSVLRRSSALLLLIVLAAVPNRPIFDFLRANRDYDQWVAAPLDVEGSCRSFFVMPASAAYTARSSDLVTLYAIDAMFVALDTSIPTLNGYSGRLPRGWNLGDPHDPEYARAVSRWTARHGLAGVCEFDIERRTLRPFVPPGRQP